MNFTDRYISVNHNLTDRPVGAERVYERHIQTTMDIYAEATQEKKQEVVTKLAGKIVIK